MKRISRGICLGLLGALGLSACGGGGGGGDGSGGVTAPTTGTGTPQANLALTAFTAPGTLQAGATYTVTGTLTNLGGASIPGHAVAIGLSPQASDINDYGAIGMALRIGWLEPGQSWDFSTTIVIPDDAVNGNYNVNAVIATDAEYDTTPGNNALSRQASLSGGVDCTNDAHEQDNKAATAQALAFGETRTGNFCDGTSDWFGFSAIGGQSYSMVTRSTNDFHTHLLGLYGPDGSTLIVRGMPDIDDSGTTKLQWTAPSTGTYYVRVAHAFGLFGAGPDTDYSLTLGDARADLHAGFAYVSPTGYSSGALRVYGYVYSQGFADAGAFKTGLYLSTDPDVTTADMLLDEASLGGLAKGTDEQVALEGILPETPGDYYVAVIADNGYAIDEAARGNNRSPVQMITVSPLGTCDADAYEQDDSAATAKTITAGAAPQLHNHCEDLVDWLAFSAVKDRSYMVRVQREFGGYSEATADVYSADGATLLGSATGATQWVWTAPADGAYRLRVSNPSAGSARSYDIRLDEFLPDLKASLSASGLSSGTPAGGVIDSAYTSTLNVGPAPAPASETGLYLSSDNVVTTGDLLIGRMTMQAMEGSLSSPYSGGGGYLNGYLPKTLTPGTYYVAAIANHNGAFAEPNTTNNTSAVVEVLVTTPPCTPDAYEDDDHAAAAHTITLNEPRTRNGCDDREDWLKFSPATSGWYATSSGESVKVYHQGDLTKSLAASIFGRVSWQATAGEVYFIRSDSPTTTSYALTVGSCQQDAYEEDDDYSQAKPIAPGQSQSRNYCDGDDDWISFGAVSGTTYTITTGDTTSLTLYGSDGQTWLQNHTTKGKSRQIVWTATSSGTLYVRLQGNDVGMNTGYSVSLN